MTSPTTKERRNGKERRAMPPQICGEVCKPIVLELNQRDEKLKIELDKRDKVFHGRLDNLNECVQDKIPSRLFWKLAGGAAFIIFIGIGGALWEMKSSVADLSTYIKVMAVTLENTSEDLKIHLVRSERKSDQVDERLNKIEQGETYYRYHNKNRKEIEK